MSEQSYYFCAICDIELTGAELADGCCPYYGTEIPAAVEKVGQEEQ